MPIDLARNYRKTLAELTESLRRELGDSLESVVLYGSFARGDFHDEGDIDALLIVNDKKLGDKASDLRYDIDLRNGTFTSIFLAAACNSRSLRFRKLSSLENLPESSHSGVTWQPECWT